MVSNESANVKRICRGKMYADYNGFSLREVKIAIDCDLDKEE